MKSRPGLIIELSDDNGNIGLGEILCNFPSNSASYKFQLFKDIFANKLLNKNGKLILTTFNMDSLYAKITRKNYHWIIPFHLVYFSNKTLKDIGKKNNLELYKIENDIRTVSVGYLLEKLIFIFPRLSLIFKFLFKFKLLRKLSIKINLRDLNIYYYIKSN